MRFVKLGIISIIVFALLITAMSLLFPSHIRISKAIDINSQRDTVLLQLREPGKWKKWYPGADSLELLVVDGKTEGLLLTGAQGTIRVTGSTDSTVTAVTSGKTVREAVTGWNVFPTSLPNTVTVQWYMDFHLRWYPWEKFSSLLLEKRYGPIMEKGLANLKSLLEK